jgi:hypothetical protein
MLCRCQSSAARSSSLPDAATSASKYDRIIAFVEAHATPVVAAGSTSSSMFPTGAEQPSSWHNSYDEEAEEGELLDEPHLVLSAAAAALPASSAFAAAAAAATPAAATVLVNSWSYGSAENPKPWCFSWDEEAEGDFELGDCARLTPAQARQQRRVAMHEARHAARADRKLRRAQLHPQLGDLEHMTAWVGQQQEQSQQQERSQASLQYQQLLALVAGDAGRQYRKPKQWHLTFDEDVHGDAPETVLGSC